MANRAARRRTSSSSSSNRPSWVDLPVELTANIFQRLTLKDIFRTAKVCTTWRSVCRNPSIWRSLDLWDREVELNRTRRNWDRTCREVVNRSEGQLVSLNIGHFATDDLLYIAHRAKQLRHLRIRSGRVSDEGFSKAVKEFPLLEELQLEYCAISKKSIEAAGQSCPFLKSFSFIKESGCLLEPCDEEADAIAENMHDLKHLSVVGNEITGEGVRAILDSCPHLESLNLCNCDYVCLVGDLEKRCSQQIKDLKHGYDPTAEIRDLAFLCNVYKLDIDVYL